MRFPSRSLTSDGVFSKSDTAGDPSLCPRAAQRTRTGRVARGASCEFDRGERRRPDTVAEGPRTRDSPGPRKGVVKCDARTAICRRDGHRKRGSPSRLGSVLLVARLAPKHHAVPCRGRRTAKGAVMKLLRWTAVVGLVLMSFAATAQA